MVQIRQTERRLNVLELLRQRKTETEIADSLNFSRNTIVRDVRWLKENLAYDFTLITNEIIQKLHERIDKMTNRDLIAFFGKLYMPPQRMEVKEEIETKTDITLTLNEMSEDEREFCKRIARNYIKRNNQTRSRSIH